MICSFSASSDLNNIKVLRTCVEPMQCANCIKELYQIRSERIGKMLESIKSKDSLSITEISLKIIPSREGLRYYSIDNIEMILHSLFKTRSKSMLNDILRSRSFVKVQFVIDKYFLLPVLEVSVYFLHKLKSMTIEMLWRKLKSEILMFTGQIGDVSTYQLNSKSSFGDLLYSAFLVGENQFQKSEQMKSVGIGLNQAFEMDMLHRVGFFELESSWFDFTSSSSEYLFRNYISCLEMGKDEYESLLDGIMASLFGDNQESLPF